VETVEFLGDIDDAELYTKQVELAYGLAYEEIIKILIEFPGAGGRVILDEKERCVGWDDTLDSPAHGMLHVLQFTMKLTLRNMADRRRRLADVAVGLPDVVLDEEST